MQVIDCFSPYISGHFYHVSIEVKEPQAHLVLKAGTRSIVYFILWKINISTDIIASAWFANIGRSFTARLLIVVVFVLFKIGILPFNYILPIVINQRMSWHGTIYYFLVHFLVAFCFRFSSLSSQKLYCCHALERLHR